MQIFDVGRHAPCVCVAALLLSACSAAQSQPPIGRNSIGSWMLPEAKSRKSILMYAGGLYGNVYVYDYFTGKQFGELSDIGGDFGMCVDARGDVYIGQSNKTTLEYAHGGTKVLNTYATDEISDGCSVDARNDVAITSESASSPGVTVFAGGNPSKGKTYSNRDCKSTPPMGYDTGGDLIGLGDKKAPVYICALLADSKTEQKLATSGFTINAAGKTMWDGKYFALTDQDAKYDTDGIVQASLSGKTVKSHGETILTDTCYNGYTAVTPFIVGDKNTPVNDRQGKVLVGTNTWCSQSGDYVIEFWHYPSGGNPYKVYKIKAEIWGVGAISIGS